MTSVQFDQFNLNPNIFKALQACGYDKPTPIQARSIPDILSGKDLVACAQTGTGKTAAFVLPALHRLCQSKSTMKPRVLILTPTRELATQIMDSAVKYGKFLRFNIVSLVGGMPYRQQLRRLSQPVDIIIATPGRLLDHMENRKVDLSSIEMLILDEADRMLDMGFIDDVRAIAKATPNSRQTLLFSATVDDKLAPVVRHLLKDPIKIDLSTHKIAPAEIKQIVYLADAIQHKNKLLQHILANEKIFKAIIFSGTKINADKLARQLEDQGFPAAPLHGDLKQSARNRTIEQFHRGKIQFLVATDIAARGIHIQDITHVINFDLPRFYEDYVHRIGRTGRAGKSGIAISFAMPMEARQLQKIEKYLGHRLEIATIAGLEPKQDMNYSLAPKKKNKRFSKSNSQGGQKRGFKNDERRASSGNGKRGFNRRDDDRKSSGGGEKRDFKRSYKDDDRKGSGGGEKRDFKRSFKDDERQGSGGGQRREFSRGRDDERQGLGGKRREFNRGRDDERQGSGDKRREFSRGRDDERQGSGSQKREFSRGSRDDERQSSGVKRREFSRDRDDEKQGSGGQKRERSFKKDERQASGFGSDKKRDFKRSFKKDGDSSSGKSSHFKDKFKGKKLSFKDKK